MIFFMKQIKKKKMLYKIGHREAKSLMKQKLYHQWTLFLYKFMCCYLILRKTYSGVINIIASLMKGHEF